MGTSFDEALVRAAIARHVEMDHHYARWPDHGILIVPFDSIAASGAELITRIARFAELPVPNADTIQRIEQRFSKQRVRKQIAAIEAAVFDSAGNVRDDADPDAILDTGSGRHRAFDTATGFQSGHVSGRRPGDWEHVWTAEQKRIVNDAIRVARRTVSAADR